MNVLPTAPFTASMPRITDGQSPPEPVDVVRTPYAAVIFDMDGVVTDTAGVHARAWQKLFDRLLTDPRLEPVAPATEVDRRPFDMGGDYRTYVDGRRREDGVRALLAARGTMLPEAQSHEDPQPGDWTVQGQAAAKDGFFHEELREHGVRVFTGTVALIERLREGGVPVGLVTASRNSAVVLEAAGLQHSFDRIVDGNWAASHDLPGKPAPDTFLECARLLGVAPGESVVVEDAVAGVQAGAAGDFGLVVGINRDGARERLYRAGAHVVLNDVAELDLGARRDDPWALVFDGFDPATEPRREALLTLANGYMGVRGAACEFAANTVHYPGTYLAGVFNRVLSHINGRDVEHESMVNVPNWLHLDLRFAEGQWWSEGGMKPSEERVELDLRRGLLTRTLVLTEADEDPGADQPPRSLEITQRRLVSLRYRHLGAQETRIVSRGFSGRLHVRTGVDPAVTNSGVAEYRELNAHHLALLESTTLPDEHETLLSLVRTSQSKIEIAMAQRTRIESETPVRERREVRPGGIEFRRYTVQIDPHNPVLVDSTTAVVTSRDAAIGSPREGALAELNRTPFGVRKLLASHEIEWARLWDRYEVTLEAAEDTPEHVATQLAVRTHLFHAAQTLAPHLSLRDAGIPARGLHGEGYRGHIFWDELFILPVINMRQPHVTRSLLSYRWRRLAMAQQHARDFGLYGAAFPWQSGSDGREETPPELYNHHSRRWLPDNSWRQFHVGLAIAYNAWVYYESTGDIDWLSGHGTELIVGITRLFASLAEYDSHDGKYHISGVMGPDEYHDGPAGQHGGGLKDNAYTNVLASWLFRHSAHIFHDMVEHQREDLESRFEISPQEVQKWLKMAENMYVPFNADGTIAQFEGYDELAELDWDFYRTKYRNIGRLDLLLENEGDLTNNYKLSKQADTIMLVYLLGPEGLIEELARMGYTTDLDAIQRTVDHYIARSSNGSSLSRVVNAAVLAWLDPDRSWGSFQDALMIDMDDTQGGTTGEGIHLGAMAGSVDVITRAYAGLRVRGQWLEFQPALPRELDAVDFTVLYCGQVIEVSLDHDILELEASSVKADPVTVHVNGAEYVLKGGQKISVSLRHRESRRPEKAMAALRRRFISDAGEG